MSTHLCIGSPCSICFRVIHPASNYLRVNIPNENNNEKVDDNRKVSRRLEDFKDKVNEYFKYLENRFDKKCDSNYAEQVKLNSRIDDIEGRNVSLRKELTDLQILSHDEYMAKISRKPFKCPVCNGTLTIDSKVVLGMKVCRHTGRQICHTCDGKGIVWG
jgi:hypothetical protein